MFSRNSLAFFNDPTVVGNLISGSSGFSKSSLNIWKFMLHIMLKPGLENFEHYFARVMNPVNVSALLGLSAAPRLSFPLPVGEGEEGRGWAPFGLRPLSLGLLSPALGRQWAVSGPLVF